MPDARDLVLVLLAARSPDATVCPSEVARALARSAPKQLAAWRESMPAVHAAVDELVAAGMIHLSWKGQALAARAGPYRIGRGVSGQRQAVGKSPEKTFG